MFSFKSHKFGFVRRYFEVVVFVLMFLFTDIFQEFVFIVFYYIIAILCFILPNYERHDMSNYLRNAQSDAVTSFLPLQFFGFVRLLESSFLTRIKMYVKLKCCIFSK